MTWKDLFSNSWRGDEVEIKIFDHLRHPDKLTSADSIALYDRSAAETIRRMEEALEALKGYRQALAEMERKNTHPEAIRVGVSV